ncbi:hypothetical protein [Larkinella humicola]|uniref:DUF2642 domain-containing protein n=1 Tax=Larkinella humicola TaxID=2607654 RepID=A0A5N1J8T7_9BACT|nr:hypothetical protein [Larkinella humicola]KAA9347882.1 hypothetical protein F0P93_24970 [Larkinella humicola]
MGKRLIRIRAMELLNQWTSASAARLVNAEVNVVFLDGRTLHGRLVGIQGSELSIRDNIGHNHTVLIQTVDEVILDEKAPF